jgi:hypothetical protein
MPVIWKPFTAMIVLGGNKKYLSIRNFKGVFFDPIFNIT